LDVSSDEVVISLATIRLPSDGRTARIEMRRMEHESARPKLKYDIIGEG